MSDGTGKKAEDQKRKSMAGCVNCTAVVRDLREVGAELPATFRAAWDDELKAWVGRR